MVELIKKLCDNGSRLDVNSDSLVCDGRTLLGSFEDNSKHYSENDKDYVVFQGNFKPEYLKEAFRIANKRVIITHHNEFNLDALNMDARRLSVSVSYGKINEEHIVVVNKHLDNAVFQLDDFHDTNHNLPLLLSLKGRFPKLKVTLFCIPSKCSVKFLQSIKDRYSWIELAVHGWFHDSRGLVAQEANFWTKEEANQYLQMAEDMGVFVKGFKAPGWNINHETYEVLAERGYWISEHKDHDRWEKEIKLPRYKTGHLCEVNGHIQNCNMNGLEELATTKCNFSPQTEFRWVSEALDTEKYLPNAY